MGISPSEYVREAVKNYKDSIPEHILSQYQFPKLATNAFPTEYEQVIDVCSELNPDLASYFQSLLVGVMCWMVSLGCIDVAMEVSLLSLHSVLRHERHMYRALYIVANLGLHHNSCLCMDPTGTDIDNEQFPLMDWKEFYSNAKEPIPPNFFPVDIHIFVNTNHAGDKQTWQPCRGFLI